MCSSSRFLPLSLFLTNRTSYTIDESSSCSASSSLSSRCTTTTNTMAKSSMLYGQQCRNSGGDYGNVPKDNRRGTVNTRPGPGITVGCHRPPSIASCSSIYETIVESVNKFPMQTMHSNKTCKYTYATYAFGLEWNETRRWSVDGRTRHNLWCCVGPRRTERVVRSSVMLLNTLSTTWTNVLHSFTTAVKSPPEFI